jgi:hypothetical protein
MDAEAKTGTKERVKTGRKKKDDTLEHNKILPTVPI